MRLPQLLLLAALVLAGGVFAAAPAYDETADAQSDLTQALARAKTKKHPVLVIFGANWCPDCRALDAALKEPKNAALIAREFVVVKVDVGNFDHNIDLAEQYGNPVKAGIPAALVLSPGNEVLYATRTGELANARHMGDTGIYDFFHQVAAAAKAKKPGKRSEDH